MVQKLTTLAGITPEDVVFLAGSTQAPEEALAIKAYRKLSASRPSLRLSSCPGMRNDPRDC